MSMVTESFPKRYKSLPQNWRVVAHIDESANEILGFTAINFVLNYESSEIFYSKYKARQFILANYSFIEGDLSSLNEKS